MSLAEDNLRFTVLKAIVDAGEAELKKRRITHTNTLVEQYKEAGSKTWSVRLPSGELVAEVRLSVPHDDLQYTDPDAFTAWLEANHPGAVQTEFIPGEPEHTVVVPATEDRHEKTIDPKRLTEITERFKVEGEKVIDTATGVVVDGVKNVPGGTPKSFSVNYEGKTDGRDMIAAAYREGKLDEIVAGSTLPAVGAPVIERHLVAAPVAIEDDPAPDPVDLARAEERWADPDLGVVASPADEVDVDELGPEYSDGVHPLPGDDPWSAGRPVTVAAATDPFDPGSW